MLIYKTFCIITADILGGKVASASADTRPCALIASTRKVSDSETDVSNSSLFMTPFHTRLDSGLAVTAIFSGGVHSVVPVFRDETLKWVMAPPPV